MTKYLQFTLLFFLLMLTGCFSEETQDAASKAASAIKATNYQIGKGTVTETDKESYNSINIEFSDFNGLQDGYDNEKLSSIAVLVFFKNLKSKDYSGFDKIQVTLNLQNTTVNTLYDIKQLIETDKHFNTASDFIKGIHEKSIVTMQKYTDTSMIDRNSLDTVYDAFKQLDSTYGQFNDNVFTGFKYSKLKEQNIPVFVTWSELKHDSANTVLKLMINTSNDKIVFIGINGE